MIVNKSVKQDAKRFRYLLEHCESIGFASGDREPDSWIDTNELRVTIDKAIKENEVGKKK